MKNSEGGYNPSEIEQKFYKIWENRGYFEIDGNKNIQKDGKNFCIVMPPPNVTGSLHIGHALNSTLQDIAVRYKRMDGYKVLWQPGMDHAGIATQNVVEKRLLAEGVKKEELGREKFVEKVWEWKAYSGGAILKQQRALGISPAWSRERFTMDEGLERAVKKAFVELYKKGLIIKGSYMINWCTHDGALSDIEVDYKEKNGFIYHIRYPIKDSSESVVVATTRPETYFGDTAVMVHPDDERYRHLVGKKVILPIIDREVEIIADSHVDMEFGTGLVKVTPAHDPNDYEVGKRRNLEFITIFDENGILNDECGEFKGSERLEARADVVERLKELGFLEGVEEHKNQVGHCYRCGNVVEPYISSQWFVKKETASEAIKKANLGESKFFPKQWKNNYDAWMRELRDWCISRQLWWGHRIPVFYCESCGYEWASEMDEDSCPKCKSAHIRQDKDVLDTWFSSALWSFSTLGWGNGVSCADRYNSTDLDEFYPNSLLITGFDILFFWVARMMVMGEQFMVRLPFDDIYLHALVRDEKGEKMSKSKGNVIDPLDKIEAYGADVLRFTLASMAGLGRDIKLGEKNLENSRNFLNKLYNASRYLQMKCDRFDDLESIEIKTPLGKYMNSRLNACIKESREALDAYRFNDACTSMYRFLWNEFCDWGIELSKNDESAIPELGAIFKESMKLIHPMMPFVSEYLYQSLGGDSLENAESLMVKRYPSSMTQDSEAEKIFDTVIDSVVTTRRLKALLDMPASLIDRVYIKVEDEAVKEHISSFLPKLARVQNIEFVSAKEENTVADIGEFCEVFLSKEGIELKPIVDRLRNQEKKLIKETQKLESMLGNDRFVKNAPEDVIEQQRAQLEASKNRLDKTILQLKQLDD
jgi:valyl-tRNA synthetase